MRVVQQAIENGIGKGRLTDVIVPVVDRQLAGDEGGAGAHAIIQDLEQIIALALADRGDGEVINDQQSCFGEAAELFAQAAIGVRELELFEQTRRPQVEGREALTASLIAQARRRARFCRNRRRQ